VALRKGGDEFPVELALASLKLRNRWYAVGIARDITQRRHAEEMLRENESRLIDMFENLSSGVAIYHASPDLQDFTITAFNRAAERIDNKYREDLIGKNVLEVFPAIAEFGLLEVFRRVWISGIAEHFPVTLYQDEHITGWRENYVYKLPNGEIVAIYDDVTKEKQAEERMHHLAHYDALTGLPNRSLFADRLHQALATAKREKTRVALMFLDLDKFKPVNDNLGHDVGDMLLKEVAKRMLECVRDSDTVSRLGGDEFVILLPNIEAEQVALRVAGKILNSLNQTFELAGHSINISSSIGVAVYPEHGGDEKLLTRNADTAMYYAKNGGRNNVKLFKPEMTTG
jgi:diguanylate cyclase (GGDEF)-like protein